MNSSYVRKDSIFMCGFGFGYTTQTSYPIFPVVVVHGQYRIHRGQHVMQYGQHVMQYGQHYTEY